MASKFSQGRFVPKNPKKYIGKTNAMWRSSWELSFMSFCDENASIINWASEPIRIPYKNPLTGKNSIYIPDFLISYVDKDGTQLTELIEIKPNNQVTMENAKSSRDKAAVLQNQAKWQMAAIFAKQNNIKFRIVTENDLFPQGNKSAANKVRNKYKKKTMPMRKKK